jgi:hypothetical protein
MADPKPAAQNPDEKVRVKVVVAPRENFPGVWAAGRLFPNGETEAVVTRRELENIKGKKAGIAVVELGAAPADAQTTGATTPAAQLAQQGSAGPNYDTRTATSPLDDADAMQSGQSSEKSASSKKR